MGAGVGERGGEVEVVEDVVEDVVVVEEEEEEEEEDSMLCKSA